MRLSEQLRRATEQLAAAGVATPRVDAELLAAFVLEIPRSRLILVDLLTHEQADKYQQMVGERAKRTPLQHLTGTAPFLGLELRVGPGVFIPRPETELLATWAIAAIGNIDTPVVVDLCSGSGAIALAILEACPDAEIYAAERSPEALKWLHRNANGTSLTVIEGDIRDVELPSNVDLITANPPYVPFGTVEREVQQDPREAVFGGEDGMELIPALIMRAAAQLKPGGWLGFEHDDTHTNLKPLLEMDFTDIVTHPDLAGRPRYTTARRKACQTGTL